MLKLTHAILNNLRSNNNKTVSVVRFDKYLKSTIAEAKSTETEIQSEEEPKVQKYPKSRNSMVAAAFASLKPISAVQHEIQTPRTDDKINKATNIDELLSISVGTGISRKHALKVVSTLAEWTSSGKTNLADFESDTRFIKLCRILTKGAKVNRTMMSRNEDLTTILNVTADDEAARLVSSLNLPQMVKVMSTLCLRKRRSVLLLRTLAYNITGNSGTLNLKQSADVLYSMCLLSFIDENLLAKICGDIEAEIKKDTELSKSSVIGSIVTSLGLLKYKNCEILDTLSEWILRYHTMCRPQDIFSLFVTLATVNYLPNNSEELFKVLLPQMTVAEARKAVTWLNFVWSLIILNQATPAHVSSVLSQDFVDKIEGSKSLNLFARVKLLNINGAAKYLLTDYSGDLLSPLSSIHEVNVIKTKESSDLLEAVTETLKNLIQSENLLKLNTNTGLGFYIDAECLLDKKCNPLPFDKESQQRSDVSRVAIMTYDFRNMCINKVEPSGANVLARRLLEAQNYKVLEVPFTEFKMTDKLVGRVQYLESRLKNIAK